MGLFELITNWIVGKEHVNWHFPLFWGVKGDFAPIHCSSWLGMSWGGGEGSSTFMPIQTHEYIVDIFIGDSSDSNLCSYDLTSSPMFNHKSGVRVRGVSDYQHGCEHQIWKGL